MSLEKIERYMEELEAIKHYKDVKGERDELLKRVEELESELTAEREKARKYSKKVKELEREVRKKDSKIFHLEVNIKVKDDEIREPSWKKSKLPLRVRLSRKSSKRF